MKAVKILLKALAFVLILVVAAVATLPLWFGPVVKTAANAAVPGIVKTDFRLEHLSLNPYTARFELGNLNLGNPQGYSVKEAVKVGDVVFDADAMSLLTDVIHIEEITIRDLFVSVVSGGENNVMNFKQIQYNVAGGKDKYEAAQSEKEAKAASVQDVPASEQKTQSERPAKKVIIDRLEISGLTIQLSFLPIRIPSIVLTDIGRQTGGATLQEAWQQILDGIMKSAGVAGDQLKALSVLSGDAVKRANKAVSKATAQAAAVSETATKTVDSTVGAATGVVNGGTKAVGDSVKSVEEGAKAVGDSAKKAVESLKSLW